MLNTKLRTKQATKAKGRVGGNQKPVTKTNMAISIDIDLAEQLRDMARLEDRSISYVIQKCVEGFLPVIKSVHAQNASFNLESMLNRVAAAVMTPDMRRCGVMPSTIELNEKGQVVIGLQRLKDEKGNPISIKSEDISEPNYVPRHVENDGMSVKTIKGM